MIKIWKIREQPRMAEEAARWFHEKWHIPLEAYQESIRQCLRNESVVPQWPNVCAVYVEEACRCRGIAGELLKAVCDDMAAKGISTLYLLTDHTSFYERYGWEFLCMVQGDGEPEMSRMYVHRQ